MDKVTVIIVNWNAGDQLLECVNSVTQYGVPLVGQIIVVDNGSTDGSDDAIAKLPQVTLVRAGANLGFGKACNLGAAHSNSEFILFLNPDACLFPDSLTKVHDFMQLPRNRQVGICGLQLIDKRGHIARSCARFPSPNSIVAHAIGIDRMFPALCFFMSEWDHATTRQVDHVIGAFYFVRRPLFEKIQGFDERYFVYLEDLDFSWRAKQIGWSSVYLADAQAFHAGGGTSDQVKAKRLFYSLRSRVLYAFKHFGPFKAMLVLIATICIEPFSRLVLALIRRSWMSLKETCTAYGMLMHWLPNWIFKGTTR